MQRKIFIIYILTLFINTYSLKSENKENNVYEKTKKLIHKIPLYAGYHATDEEKEIAKKEIERLQLEQGELQDTFAHLQYSFTISDEEKQQLLKRIAEINHEIELQQIILGEQWSIQRKMGWAAIGLTASLATIGIDIVSIPNYYMTTSPLLGIAYSPITQQYAKSIIAYIIPIVINETKGQAKNIAKTAALASAVALYNKMINLANQPTEFKTIIKFRSLENITKQRNLLNEEIKLLESKKKEAQNNKNYQVAASYWQQIQMRKQILKEIIDEFATRKKEKTE